ncbi:MAG: 16S rRNA (guanine(966)-N(2))-methyltransferase RsmD [Acidimicrobiales bacterium]
MRVVSGDAGGRKLVAPPGADTRPTSDRVREATFNALGSLHAIDDANVLDLFAGSGAMGIEALSRGAAHATFVERDRGARDAIERNLAATGFAAQAAIVAADAVAWAVGQCGAFDLAICDPPYTFARWIELLGALAVPLAVLESGHEVDPGEGWEVVRVKRYGTTVVTIARRTRPPAQHAQEAAP